MINGLGFFVNAAVAALQLGYWHRPDLALFSALVAIWCAAQSARERA